MSDAKNKTLPEQITELEAKVTTLTEANAGFVTKNAELIKERDAANIKATTAETAKTTAEAALATANTNLAAETKAKDAALANVNTLTGDNAKLKSEAKTAEERAVIIAAAAGAADPAKADASKGANSGGKGTEQLTGLAAVEAHYAKYENAAK